MARKKSAFGRILTLGGLAAAGYFAYKNRELIGGFLDELTAPPETPFEPETPAEDFSAAVDAVVPEEERDIIIDRTTED